MGWPYDGNTWKEMERMEKMHLKEMCPNMIPRVAPAWSAVDSTKALPAPACKLRCCVSTCWACWGSNIEFLGWLSQSKDSHLEEQEWRPYGMALWWKHMERNGKNGKNAFERNVSKHDPKGCTCIVCSRFNQSSPSTCLQAAVLCQHVLGMFGGPTLNSWDDEVNLKMHILRNRNGNPMGWPYDGNTWKQTEHSN